MTTFGFQARVLASFALALASLAATAAELPAPPAGLTALAKPVRMPAFNLATPSGGTTRAEEFRDKVVIARFWATW
jgi:hypothetical protein